MQARHCHTSIWFSTLLVSCPLLVACTTPATIGLHASLPSNREAMQIRLLDVALPLLVAAAEWCPIEQEPTYGLFLQDDAGVQSDQDGRLQGRPVVSYVHPRLPAALADLRAQDIVLRVNTRDVTQDSAAEVGRYIQRLTLARIQPLQLEVQRGTGHHLVSMWAVPACHYSMHVLEADEINGVTNGRQIWVTSGALRLFSSNDELGGVVAHEIAHNVLSHVENAKLQAMLGSFLGATGTGAQSMPTVPPRRSLEAQADYVGAYLMARAGYDVLAIRQVWDRLGRIQSQQLASGRGLAETHPSTAERLAAFEDTLKEIEETRRTGQPLQMRLDKAY